MTLTNEQPTADAPAFLRPEVIASVYSVDISTVTNWIRRGVPVDGRRVKLAAVKIGGCWRIPCAAWEAFLAAFNPAGVPETVAEAAARDRRVDAAAAAAYGFAAAASPSAASTLSSSFELLSAKIGTGLVPAMDDVSYHLQKFGNWWEDAVNKPMRQARDSNPTDFLGKLQKGIATDLGPQNSDMARNIDARLQSRFMGFSQYGEAIQTAGLNAGAREVDSKVLQEQLKVLSESHQLLTKLVENTKGLDRAPLFG